MEIITGHKSTFAIDGVFVPNRQFTGSRKFCSPHQHLPAVLLRGVVKIATFGKPKNISGKHKTQ